MTHRRNTWSLLCLAPSLLLADTYPRQSGIEATHYVFRVTLGDQGDDLSGEASVSLRLRESGLREAWLDLVCASGGKGMTVAAVTRDGTPVAFTHSANRLHLPLPAAARAGQSFTFNIQYRGIPANGLRMLKNKHGERVFFSENWPDHARDWLPVVDHISSRSSGEFIVTAPAHYQVVANGQLIETTDLQGGLRRTHWTQTVPLPTWLFNVGVARFSVRQVGKAGQVPLESWVFPQEQFLHAGFAAAARKALEFFAGRIAPYPYVRLASVESTGFEGAMEVATSIFYGENSVDGRGMPLGDLVAHEIAHQWFGNTVTESDWDDVWLSEGFATYLQLLFTEHDQGQDAFVKGLERNRNVVLDTEKKLPDTPVIHRNISDLQNVLNPLVYEKAGWVLHMLRRQVGTELFWDGLRSYYRRYQGKVTTTQDFQKVMEEVSGQDLAWFFSQWLTRPGVPRIAGSWTWEPNLKRVIVDLTQEQPGEPYRLKLDLGLGTTVQTVELATKTLRAEFPMEAEPAAVTLDPLIWTLMDGSLKRR